MRIFYIPRPAAFGRQKLLSDSNNSDAGMENVPVDPQEPACRTRSGRPVRAPKRYVPVETPLDDFSDAETDDVNQAECSDEESEKEPGPRRKRARYSCDSDEESEDESDTGSDLQGFIVDDDEEYTELSDDEDTEDLFESDADSEEF